MANQDDIKKTNSTQPDGYFDEDLEAGDDLDLSFLDEEEE